MHMRMVCVPVTGINGWGASFHMLALQCNHAVCATGPAESDRSRPAIFRLWSAFKPQRRGPSMPANPVLWNLDERGVATVTLNRPEVNNAYDAGLINGVLAAMDELGKKPNLRVVVLKGNGKHFQAGADLKWINGVRPKSQPRTRRCRALPSRRCSGSIRCRSRPWRWCRAAVSAAAPASFPPATW